ncbi:tRNA lysidine(34) synthetase TilS [Gordonia paraffinivorans]|uniref:tRNA lysidine(34) synthetase TilS n=1 Tax=Gordonia paraffinivorans TaxID=175628 RepID=UPI001C92CFAD|nr:tRNA lysidine(34) synthetase TilS [Gordonia paraffinivorans]MBY4573473.1 tRNA lysidine(34) synthetase TilS [Gordonia paraffinivorans]
MTRAVADFAATHLDGPATPVCVGLSGGPDSLALTACAVRAGLDVTALVVDHGLQRGSAAVAARAADAARRLGAQARVLPVEVGSRGGLEAAAREARYEALDAAREGRPVLLGHTADDQAETVLLGLARGSGARSIAGMRPWREPWGRPLLGVRRVRTLAVCTELGLEVHHDPHNRDPRFTRVRLRSEVIPLLDDVLQGGVVDALGRTAAALQDDLDALDGWAEAAAKIAIRPDGLDCVALDDVPAAIRTRVVRLWLREVGATEPTQRVIAAVDRLVTGSGGGQVAIGGDPDVRSVVERSGRTLTVRLTER